VAENGGRRLRFTHPDAPAGAPLADAAPAAARALLRHLGGLRRGGLAVVEIDGAPARASPRLAGLEAAFEIVRDHKQITLNSR